METGPVSKVWLTESFRGQAATLERLRVHRQLDEALAQGPDPLHLASVLGLDPKTAIRYAENARMLLVTAAEQQDPLNAEASLSCDGPEPCPQKERPFTPRRTLPGRGASA